MRGFVSFPQPVEEHKVRGKPEKFAEHYNQARLFWDSQSDLEKLHIIRAFRFELTKVQTAAVRQRMVAGLRNVAEELARSVAEGLGMDDLPEPLPRALPRAPKPEVRTSGALSLFARPGAAGIETRRIAILVAEGVDGRGALRLHETLSAQGAVPRFVGIKLGRVASVNGEAIEVELSMETAPSVLWDAMIIPDGEGAAAVLAQSGHALEFLKDQYRHCKTMLLLGAAGALLGEAGIPATLSSGDTDPGLLQFASNDERAVRAFVEALARHRHWQRESDPPTV
jgi:catalase